MAADLLYVRSKDGKTVHKHTCRYASTGVPWRWADGLTLRGMGQKMADEGIGWWGAHWLHLCRVCIEDEEVFEGLRPPHNDIVILDVHEERAMQHFAASARVIEPTNEANEQAN